MIRTQGTYEIQTRESMRGGTGTVTIEHLWKSDELRADTRLCARIRLEPGCSIGFHRHEGEEEIFVIVAGEGEIDDNGQVGRVSAGDTILTGDGAGHAVKAVGDAPLEMIAVINQY